MPAAAQAAAQLQFSHEIEPITILVAAPRCAVCFTQQHFGPALLRRSLLHADNSQQADSAIHHQTAVRAHDSQLNPWTAVVACVSIWIHLAHDSHDFIDLLD